MESKIKSKDFRIESVIDLKRFSNCYKLLRIATYVLKFLETAGYLAETDSDFATHW